MRRTIAVRPALRVTGYLAASMVLVAVLGAAAGRSGYLTAPLDLAAADSVTSASTTRPPDDEHHHRGRDGKDGDDGEDGRDGKDGKDGTTRTTYVYSYVTRYLDRGGDPARVKPFGQVSVHPSGGVDTGRP